jgi:hypothetical protein
MEQIIDIIAWGRVTTVQGKEFFLLAPKPFSSEVVKNGVGRSTWQTQGSYKWEVADVEHHISQRTEKLNEFGEETWEYIYTRSIIIFNQETSLIEFYQNPQTIKVKYVILDESDVEENFNQF